jgi:hypothetical protein
MAVSVSVSASESQGDLRFALPFGLKGADEWPAFLGPSTAVAPSPAASAPAMATSHGTLRFPPLGASVSILASS